jgi:hypothetical protein
MSAPAAYRHAQPYTTLWVILVAGFGVGAALSRSADGRDAALGIGLVVLSLLLGLLLLGRLVISVDASAVRWSFGFVGWPAWHVPLNTIVATEVAKADVYFGSGIKGSMKHRQYNVTMNGPALRLHLMDGRKVTLGTPEPERLQAFIEARLDRSLR